MDMGINHHDRLEPEVEVIHETEQRLSSVKSYETNQSSFLKKRGVFPYILAGLGIFGLGLILATGILSPKRVEDSQEFKALKEVVKQLSVQIDPLKNEIQTLRADQKAVREQVLSLTEKVAGLSKKSEGRGANSTSKRSISYKIKKGDTLQTIAEKYQVQPENIRRWNHLPPKGRLKPGQKVIIYSSTES